jgi:hypothetical protein
MQWQTNSAFFVSAALQIPLVLVVDIIGASEPKIKIMTKQQQTSPLTTFFIDHCLTC